ncbi:hypothetical protein MTR67_035748 [Solanum verrucosum]|uniref:Uncharacterized protein n=1 Tax=Solanum verrucosum TaxID=315347 RepID=A0AAF0ZLS5_SOLVR|nr:hypothetical protein MTR67_035748 [Solanum verrucosum]
MGVYIGQEVGQGVQAKKAAPMSAMQATCVEGGDEDLGSTQGLKPVSEGRVRRGKTTSQVRTHEATDKLEDWSMHAVAMFRSWHGICMFIAKPQGAHGSDLACMGAPYESNTCQGNSQT